VRKWFAILLVLAFIGASTQCLAECAGQFCKVPPCHQHKQPACSIESQLVASAPDAVHSPASLIEPMQCLLQAPISEPFRSDDFHFNLTASETPPLLTILRI
jgi:hypothetical protein